MGCITKSRLAGALLAATLLVVSSGIRADDGDPFEAVLEASMKEKKGVLVHVGGQGIGGRVIRLSPQVVELASREYSRIVIRRDRIDAVSAN